MCVRPLCKLRVAMESRNGLKFEDVGCLDASVQSTRCLLSEGHLWGVINDASRWQRSETQQSVIGVGSRCAHT